MLLSQSLFFLIGLPIFTISLLMGAMVIVRSGVIFN